MLEIRTYKPEVDFEFVHSTWMWKVYGHVVNKKDKVLFSQRVLDIMRKSEILIASDEEDSDVIYGCLVYEPKFKVAHYLGVKHLAEGLGIPEKLLGFAGVDESWQYTQKPSGNRLKKYGLRWSPFIYERWSKDE